MFHFSSSKNNKAIHGRSFYVCLFLVGPSLFTSPLALHLIIIHFASLCYFATSPWFVFPMHSCCMSWWRSGKTPDHSNWLRMFCDVRIVLRRLRRCWRIWSIRRMFPLESWPSSDWMGWDQDKWHTTLPGRLPGLTRCLCHDQWNGMICFYMLFLASFAIRDYKHLYESNPRTLIVLTMYNLGATRFVWQKVGEGPANGDVTSRCKQQSG